MAFPYLENFESNSWSAEDIEHKSLEMRLDEVRYRARLLRALGYDEKETLSRIEQNIFWEHEMILTPAFAGHVKQAVSQVFDRKASFGTIA